MATKKKLLVKVLFDTNIIYTGVADELLRKEVSDLIVSHASLSDIEVSWHIPEIVIMERTFQMNKKGNELLPSINKLEKLLGHNLNITSDLIEHRINETINKHLEKHSLHSIKIDIPNVNWGLIIKNSVFRNPPFEDGEKEKGFRDSLILECLKQLITDSPSTKSICRIVFITKDSLLNEAATQLTLLNNNVTIFSSIDELVSLINILNSEITEELINSISGEASKLFFEKDNKTTLYFTEDISNKIKKNFAKELIIKQEGSDTRENGTWLINKPGFEKKEKQRVFWKTIIDVTFVNYKTVIDFNFFSPSTAGIQLGSAQLVQAPTLATSIFAPPPLVSSLEQTKKEKTTEGKTRFEVMWSVTLTTKKKLLNPKVEAIKFLETVFK